MAAFRRDATFAARQLPANTPDFGLGFSFLAGRIADAFAEKTFDSFGGSAGRARARALSGAPLLENSPVHAVPVRERFHLTGPGIAKSLAKRSRVGCAVFLGLGASWGQTLQKADPAVHPSDQDFPQLPGSASIRNIPPHRDFSPIAAGIFGSGVYPARSSAKKLRFWLAWAAHPGARRTQPVAR